MEHDFWHRRWSKNEIAFHQGDINLHLQELWPQLGAAPGAAVFVPLCGKSLDMAWLARQGYRVIGVELSPLAVSDFFAGQGLVPEVEETPPFQRYRAGGVEILVGDFFALKPDHLQGAAAVYDRAALIALPPTMRPRYAAHLATLLAPGARTLLITFEYPQEEMDGPPFSVGEQEVRTLFGGTAAIERVRRLEVLAEHPRFVERGLSRLTETVYRLIAR